MLRRKINVHHVCLLLALAGLVACQQATTSNTAVPTVSASATLSSASGSSSAVQGALAASSGHNTQLNLTLPLGTSAQDVYFVFTNESSSAASSGMPTVSGDVAPSARSLATTPALASVSTQRNIAAPATNARIQAANDKIAQSWRSASTSTARSAVAGSAAVSFDSSPTSGAAVGSTTSTYIIPSSEQSSYGTANVVTTLRYASPSTVSSRKLYIWVADNVWNTNSTSASQTSASTTGLYTSGATEPFQVDYFMVNKLATQFLSTGTTDIYGCDTAIFGKEYYDSGATVASGLITPQGEIHIYILDLNPTVSSSQKGTGGTLGYFYSADNFQNSENADSNQKVMFQLDAEMLANPTVDGSLTNAATAPWSLTGSYWPNQMVSTLAHEFQHMIHFYQKQIVHSLSSSTDTWINEMCSMVTEDIVATKLGTLGPRGAQLSYSGGFSYVFTPGTLYQFSSGRTSTVYNDPASRIAFFNAYYPVTSLESWSSSTSLENYGIAYSFGSWLVRNYGGPALLHAIVTNAYTDENAVVSAVNSVNNTNYKMTDLIEQWAAAELLKTYATTVPYQLMGPSSNTFTPTGLNNNGGTSVSFTYGSINPAMYYPFDYYGSFVTAGNLINDGGGPLVFGGTNYVSSIPARAFYYYSPSGSTGLSGTRTYSVYVPANVNLQVVTVPHS